MPEHTQPVCQLSFRKAIQMLTESDVEEVTNFVVQISSIDKSHQKIIYKILAPNVRKLFEEGELDESLRKLHDWMVDRGYCNARNNGSNNET